MSEPKSPPRLVFKGDWTFTVSKSFVLNPKISMGAKIAYIALRSFCAPDEDTAFPSSLTLSKALAVSRDTIFKYVNELKDLGLVATEQKSDAGKFAHTIYTLFDTNRVGNSPLREKPCAEKPVAEKLDTKSTHKKEDVPEEKSTVAQKEKAEEIYKIYPRKAGKPKALASIIKTFRTFEFDHVKSRTEAFAKAWEGGDLTFCPMPATWFNQDRFNDSPEEWTRTKREPSRETLAKSGGPTPSGPQDF